MAAIERKMAKYDLVDSIAGFVGRLFLFFLCLAGALMVAKRYRRELVQAQTWVAPRYKRAREWLRPRYKRAREWLRSRLRRAREKLRQLLRGKKHSLI